MYTNVDPDFGPLPRTMNVQVRWLVTDTDIQLDFSEQVHLTFDQYTYSWTGVTNRDALSTTVSINAAVDPATFDITAILTSNGTPIRTIVFTHHQPPGESRWDTGVLQQIAQAGVNETHLRALA